MSKVLTATNINPNLIKAEYAVRGEIATKSEKYRQQLNNGEDKLPFDTVISANIGNPQQLDQQPLTFFRQVLSILEYPALLETEGLFPEDVKERARTLLKEVHSVGAYSMSQGVLGIRKSVAKFIESRDGFPADPNSIFLTAGASSGVNSCLNTICNSPNTGILIPVPQYPLYTATLALLNATPVPYYLDEATSWSTNVPLLKEEIAKARAEGTDVRCLVVINPGNPTGASLPEEDIAAVIELAASEKLVVMADEVYQTNVYRGEFHSFKKVLRKMQAATPGKFDELELISLHSTSKGMVGECGHRGGYFELCGFDPAVQAQIYKLVSITLCPPVIGQCLVELMVNPPAPGSPSYDLYTKEWNGIFEGLKKRSTALYDAFKTMTGVSCQDPQGAMYLFPTVTLPAKAVEAAKEAGKKPDEFYCLQMLDATGICVVPGSGFGQVEGTWHFRTTFLAPGTEWVQRMRNFHEGFMKKYQ
ncbi:pyridoxal phosphate-dependent transferase [Geopyxis carbonaria]|nr:pyridoxal phosphate-dependent transferase [Geopyxis carbonaria]